MYTLDLWYCIVLYPIRGYKSTPRSIYSKVPRKVQSARGDLGFVKLLVSFVLPDGNRLPGSRTGSRASICRINEHLIMIA